MLVAVVLDLVLVAVVLDLVLVAAVLDLVVEPSSAPARSARARRRLF